MDKKTTDPSVVSVESDAFQRHQLGVGPIQSSVRPVDRQPVRPVYVVGDERNGVRAVHVRPRNFRTPAPVRPVHFPSKRLSFSAFPKHGTPRNTYPSASFRAIPLGLSTSWLTRTLQHMPSLVHTPMCCMSLSVKYMFLVTRSTARSSGAPKPEVTSN